MPNLALALRGLRSSPGTIAAAIAMLALGIGINLAMLGLVARALLSPPPGIIDPARIVTLGFGIPGNPASPPMMTISYPTFVAIRHDVPAFETVAAWQRTSTGAVVAGEQIQIDAMLVSGSYFTLLGSSAHLGRTIQPEDERELGSPAAVLSHAFWQSAFGGGDVIGKHITVRGADFTVAGVMPPAFSGHSAARVDVWVPFPAAMQNTPGWDRSPMRIASILGRVKLAESAAAAAAQSTQAVNRPVTVAPIAGADIPATDRRIAYWLAAVSVLVLLIALANAATLLIVRGARRQGEHAIRTALGATRRRLIANVLLEAVILSLVSTGAALVLAYWFEEAVRLVLLPALAQNEAMAARTLLAAIACGVLAFAVAAIAGIIQLPATLRLVDLPAMGRSRRRRATQTGLLIVQTTLSVLLLSGAGLLARSLHALRAQDLGMHMDGVVIVDFEQGPGFGSPRGPLFEPALAKVKSIPGVEVATLIQMIPFTGFYVPPIAVPGHQGPPNVNGQLPFLIAATPDFLDILGIEIVEGRRFTANDDERGAPVVIVNQSMARGIWPGESAIGKCIRVGFDPDFDPQTAVGPPTPSAAVPCREIVGVARDVRQRSVVPTGMEDRLMQYFVPYPQTPKPPFVSGPWPEADGLLLRTSSSVDAIAGAVRRAVVDGRTDVPFIRVRPYAQLLERQIRPWQMGTTLLAIFGGLAAIVAGMGLYAAFAHAVTERRREMAIRMAVGAGPRRVLVMVLREAAVLAAVGTICGCMLTIAAGRWLQSMLFGTAPTDPLALGIAAALMIAIATVATLLPARTASLANPSSLLRTE